MKQPCSHTMPTWRASPTSCRFSWTRRVSACSVEQLQYPPLSISTNPRKGEARAPAVRPGPALTSPAYGADAPASVHMAVPQRNATAVGRLRLDMIECRAHGVCAEVAPDFGGAGWGATRSWPTARCRPAWPHPPAGRHPPPRLALRLVPTDQSTQAGPERSPVELVDATRLSRAMSRPQVAMIQPGTGPPRGARRGGRSASPSGMADYPWHPGTATGMGSLPGPDMAEALRIVLGELPDLPHQPELPARGPGADLIGRSAALLVDIAVDLQPSGWRLGDRAGVGLRRVSDMVRR